MFSSNILKTSLSCDIIRIACLFDLNSLITSKSSCFKSLSNAFVGSSKMSILDGFTKPLIILTTCRCPPDNFSPEYPAMSLFKSTFLYKLFIFG